MYENLQDKVKSDKFSERCLNAYMHIQEYIFLYDFPKLESMLARLPDRSWKKCNYA